MSKKTSRKTDVENNVLERDKPGPVSVATEDENTPSYTHNADKSEPLDPHLSDDNPPERCVEEKDVEDDALKRDKPGPVSVASDGEHHTSYTHNS